jgi:hypothetical protein
MRFTPRPAPISGRGGNGVPESRRDLKPEPQPVHPRCLIVVRRDEPELCEYLRALAGKEDVEILLDRRRDRTVLGADRREIDRRQPLSMEKDLRYRQYIIVSPQRRVVRM